MADVETKNSAPSTEKKLEVTALWLEGVTHLTAGVNETLGQGKMVTDIAKTLLEPTYTGVSEQGRLEAKSPTRIALKDTSQNAVTAKITELATKLVQSELEKLTKRNIEDTRKRVAAITEKFKFIAQAGVARLDAGTGFTGSDYFKGAYNARIAEAIERAIDQKHRGMRLEMEALKKVIEQVDRNIRTAEELIRRIPTTAKTLVDVASGLAPINVMSLLNGCGLTQDLVTLICESAIGLMGLSMDLIAMLAEASPARRVLKYQMESYHTATSAVKSGHEQQLREWADYIRARPGDIPPWKSQNQTAQLLEWLIQRSGK